MWHGGATEWKKNPYPTRSGSEGLGTNKLVLNFSLPCCPGFGRSQNESVLQRAYPEFKIEEILAKDNPDSLDAFITANFNDITELIVHFRLSRSVDDGELRPQLTQCFKALHKVADHRAVSINAKYYMSSLPTEILRGDGTIISVPYHKINVLNNQAPQKGQLSLPTDNNGIVCTAFGAVTLPKDMACKVDGILRTDGTIVSLVHTIITRLVHEFGEPRFRIVKGGNE